MALFHVNPAIAYWGDQYSREKLLKTMEHWNQSSEMPPDTMDFLHYGSPLLQSFCQQGRVFLEDILRSFDTDAPVLESPEAPFFLEDKGPEEKTILQRLQADLRLVRPTAAFPVGPEEARKDCSLEIHSCFSPMREIEMLHDRILHALSNPEIQPRDILVTAPDINRYVPYIDAVFSADAVLRGLYTI